MSDTPNAADDARLVELLQLAVADVTPRERRPADVILARGDRWRRLRGSRGILAGLLSISLAGGGVAVAVGQRHDDRETVTVAPRPTTPAASTARTSSASPPPGDELPPASCPYGTNARLLSASDHGAPEMIKVENAGPKLPFTLLPTASDLGGGWRLKTLQEARLPAAQSHLNVAEFPEGNAQQRGVEVELDRVDGEPGWIAYIDVVRYATEAAAAKAYSVSSATGAACASPARPRNRVIERTSSTTIVQAPPVCGGCSADNDTDILVLVRQGNLLASALISEFNGDTTPGAIDSQARGFAAVIAARVAGETPPPLQLSYVAPTPATKLLAAADIPSYFHVGGSPQDQVAPTGLTVDMTGCDVFSQPGSGVGQIYRASESAQSLDAFQEAIYPVGVAQAASFMAKLRACPGVSDLAGVPDGVAFVDRKTADNTEPVPGIVVNVNGSLVRLQVTQFYAGEGELHVTRAGMPAWLADIARAAIARLQAS